MITLEYDEAGAGQPVVLLHGHPFNRTMWRPQLRALSHAFRVIAPDLRGYGESPMTPGTVPMATLAGDVWTLLDGLGVKRTALVGLSMGGLVAMEMALAQPERVWALGLTATTAEPVKAGEREQRRALADAAEREGMRPLVEMMGPKLLAPGTDPETVEFVRAMMESNDPEGAAAALRGRAERPDYRPGLGTLRMPVWVCVGDQDEYSTAEITRELVGSLAAPQTLTLPGVGHLPNLERPDAFNAALERFLAEV